MKKQPTQIKAIFALGNPAPQYDKTYHNAGFMLLSRLSDEVEASPLDKLKTFSSYKALSGDSKVILAKSNVFMNDSGLALKNFTKKTGLKISEIAVVHDDSDLPLGTYKHSFGSGSAGHKGAQSIIDTFGTKEFHRFRIGIRTKPGKALNFVLKRIPKSDLVKLEKCLDNIVKFLTSRYFTPALS